MRAVLPARRRSQLLEHGRAPHLEPAGQHANHVSDDDYAGSSDTSRLRRTRGRSGRRPDTFRGIETRTISCLTDQTSRRLMQYAQSAAAAWQTAASCGSCLCHQLHVFHNECLRSWFSQHVRKCPICQKEIPETPAEKAVRTAAAVGRWLVRAVTEDAAGYATDAAAFAVSAGIGLYAGRAYQRQNPYARPDDAFFVAAVTCVLSLVSLWWLIDNGYLADYRRRQRQ